MVETNPSYETSLCYSADDLRRLTEGLVCVEGVSGIGDGSLLVTTGGSGLNVSIAQGGAFIEGDTSDDQGMYWVYNDATVTLTMDAAHASNPRIDQVIARVYDAQYAGSANEWALEKLTGTATVGANLTNLTGAAALPGDAIRLAYILVPAAFTGPFVDATHILDYRTSFRQCGVDDDENPTYVRVTRTSAWTTSTSAVFRFDTVEDGNDAIFDQADGNIAYTCPEEGLYLVKVQLAADPSAAAQWLRPNIIMNSVTAAIGPTIPSSSSTTAIGSEVVTIKKMLKGQTISFEQTASTAGLTGVVDTRTHAVIYRI